jgi:hypothetical protein
LVQQAAKRCRQNGADDRPERHAAGEQGGEEAD